MTELTQAIGELKTLLGQTENELNSLLAGKKASAPRMRASLQKIKSVSHSMRAVVMDYTKSLPVKSRKVLYNDCKAEPTKAENSELPAEPIASPVKKQRKKASKPTPC